MSARCAKCGDARDRSFPSRSRFTQMSYSSCSVVAERREPPAPARSKKKKKTMMTMKKKKKKKKKEKKKKKKTGAIVKTFGERSVACYQSIRLMPRSDVLDTW